MNGTSHSHRVLAVSAALAFALAGTQLAPIPAFAVTQETQAQVNETQQKVKQSAQAYEEATANLKALQEKIDENTAKIQELEAAMPAKRAKASQALRARYKNEQGTNVLMSVVLQSSSLDDLLTRMTYLDQIQSSNTEALDALNDAEADLEQQRVELEQARTQAAAEQDRADAALKEAQQLRQDAQRRADEEAAAELAKLAAAADASNGLEVIATSPLENNTSVDWGVSQEDFIASWAPRINTYLEGSALSGCGEQFASAAWKYGVDPRFSPAISNTESSKGAHLFRAYNAWGWGDIDFSSWDQAIDAHVRGLAEGYGYTISVAGAQKYCPPNWYNWYRNTLSEMQRI